MKYKIAIGANKFEVEVGKIADGRAQVSVNGESYEVMIENFAEVTPFAKAAEQPPIPATTPRAPKAPVSAVPPTPPIAPSPVQPAPPTPPKAPPPVKPAAPTPPKAPPLAPETVEEDSIIKAPISGLIMDIKVKVGDNVLAGQTVATMEAMKMENNLISNLDGTVKEILVQKGAEVTTGEVIMIIQ